MITTTDKNKVLAEFMGYAHDKDGEIILIPYSSGLFKNSSYDQWCQYWGEVDDKDLSKWGLRIPTGILDSYDWIMEVVEKIESLGHGTSITGNPKGYSCTIHGNGYMKHNFIGNSKIEIAHEACYQFAVWHKENSQS